MTSDNKDHWDLAVIGGGSGGLAAAQRAAEYGARVIVLESGRLGGTCVNVGCVPKKIMWNAAAAAHALHDAAGYGFEVVRPAHDWAALKARRDAYVTRLNRVYADNLAGKGIEYVAARGILSGPTTVRTDDRMLQADRIIVATGGAPTVPDLPGAELGTTSDGFFEFESLPARVALVGSGYISVELAGMLRALGADVSVFARFDSLIRSFDEMLQQAVVDSLAASGVGLQWHAVPSGLERRGGGVYLNTEDDRSFGPFDALIWAIGRHPLTEDLGLESAGVEVDAREFITTDKYQATSAPNIFAIGDVTGRAALTPVAIAAGRRLADRVYGGAADRYLDYDNIATVVFSHPPTGTCGLTERQARAEFGDDVRIYTSAFVPMAYSFTEHRTQSRMKLIATGPDDRIVGVHVFGPGSDEMMQGFAVAMRMGATKQDFDDTVAIHPTSAEELVTMR
ncbi:MAG: glutathione-disulfide reductase [Gammaproteobacteria bacterium]